jgi:hypothetical protein
MSNQCLKSLVHLYKNYYNMLWKHLVKIEMNSMSIGTQKHFLSSVNNVFNV